MQYGAKQVAMEQYINHFNGVGQPQCKRNNASSSSPHTHSIWNSWASCSETI